MYVPTSIQTHYIPLGSRSLSNEYKACTYVHTHLYTLQYRHTFIFEDFCYQYASIEMLKAILNFAL